LTGRSSSAARLVLPIQEMSNQEGVVGWAGKFNDDFEFTIIVE
jgi:hypothetical protein